MTSLQPVRNAALRQPLVRTLRVAYTPDSDDAFNFYGWEHGPVSIDGVRAHFEREHISRLNDAAASGAYDVVAVSSVRYPALAERYLILSSGNSIGRGYGPVLASRRLRSLDEMRGARVGVAGLCTTGGALAAMYCRGAQLVELPYDRIADGVVQGDLDAGVMIHEELLYFPEKGLRRVCDLGATWCDDTGLPLPVGLNLVRRDLGIALAREIARACRDSLLWSQEHYGEAFAHACTFGRGCAEEHVALFSNADTLCMPGDVRRALHVMFRRVADLGLGPRLESFEVIDA